MATWWWKPESKTAIVESAKIIGLAQLPPRKFHPFQLDTFGLGAVLRGAIAKGARRVIVGIGGSATNDGGFGLARALGLEFMDKDGKLISRWTELHRLSKVRPPKLRRLGQVIVAVDVQNRLLGARGATRVYGPQKGLGSEDFGLAECCLRRLAAVVKRQTGRAYARMPGSGAAGGLGFGLLAFLNARTEPGFELFARHAHLARRLCTADAVITGEGAIDQSTLMGKGVGQIARLSRKAGVPCIGMAGTVVRTKPANRLFTRVHALTDLTEPEKAKSKATFWLEQLATRVGADWRPVAV
jgi:glycerate kinase